MELVTNKLKVPAWHALHKTEATDLSKTLHKAATTALAISYQQAVLQPKRGTR